MEVGYERYDLVSNDRKASILYGEELLELWIDVNNKHHRIGYNSKLFNKAIKLFNRVRECGLKGIEDQTLFEDLFGLVNQL